MIDKIEYFKGFEIITTTNGTIYRKEFKLKNNKTSEVIEKKIFFSCELITRKQAIEHCNKSIKKYAKENFPNYQLI
jgi:exosome complex RNA-binding protein Rrp4